MERLGACQRGIAGFERPESGGETNVSVSDSGSEQQEAETVSDGEPRKCSAEQMSRIATSDSVGDEFRRRTKASCRDILCGSP